MLLGKELLDVVRDRRTLALTLLLPVLLYPSIFILMGAIITVGAERLKNEALTVAVVGPQTLTLLARQAPPAKTTWQLMDRDAALAALKEQKLAAVIEAPADTDARLESGRQAVVQVLYTKRFDRSMEALDRVRPVLETINAGALKVRLEQLELDPGFVQPVKLEAVDFEFAKDLGPLIASKILPLLMLMMLILGGLYPAVDLTAGEKERGTLETLLVSAVRPFDVMFAKYLTVSVVAVASALANLLATAATFGVGLSFGSGSLTTTFSLSLGQVAVMMICMVPAALLLSGLSLAVSSTARTFKEGQSLMTPLMLVCIAPAMISQMPGIELNHVTALIPLLDVALLIKAVVLGTASRVDVALTTLTVVTCAALALRLAASAFNSELFRFGGTDAWKALFARGKVPAGNRINR